MRGILIGQVAALIPKLLLPNQRIGPVARFLSLGFGPLVNRVTDPVPMQPFAYLRIRTKEYFGRKVSESQ